MYMVKPSHATYNYKKKGGESMALTEAKRKANNKYIAKNYTVLGLKVRKDEAEKFKEACKVAGTTPNSIFQKAMRDFMEKKTNE